MESLVLLIHFELGEMPLSVNLLGLGLILFEEQKILNHQSVHVRGHEASIGILRRADDRFSADIEAGVDDYGTAGQIGKGGNEFMEARIPVPVNRMDACGKVNMGNRRDL